METLDLFDKLYSEAMRTQYLTRLQTTPQNLSGYTVASHAHQCAIIYITLCASLKIRPKSDLLASLIIHDNMEVFTGDLLAPAKNVDNKTWDKIEQRIQYDFIDSVSPEHKHEIVASCSAVFPIEEDLKIGLDDSAYYLLKYIDLYELSIRCLEEYRCGNKCERITSCLNNCHSWMKTIVLEATKSMDKDAELHLNMMTILNYSLKHRYQNCDFTLKNA